MKLSVKNITLIIGVVIALFIGVSSILSNINEETPPVKPFVEEPVEGDSTKIKAVSFDFVNMTIQKSKTLVKLLLPGH